MNRQEYLNEIKLRKKIRSIIREVELKKREKTISLRQRIRKILKEEAAGGGDSEIQKRLGRTTAANFLDDFIGYARKIWVNDFSSLGEENQRQDFILALDDRYKSFLAQLDLKMDAQKGENPATVDSDPTDNLSASEEMFEGLFEALGPFDSGPTLTLKDDEDGIVDPNGDLEREEQEQKQKAELEDSVLDRTAVMKAQDTFDQTSGELENIYSKLGSEEERAMFTAYLSKNLFAHLKSAEKSAEAKNFS